MLIDESYYAYQIVQQRVGDPPGKWLVARYYWSRSHVISKDGVIHSWHRCAYRKCFHKHFHTADQARSWAERHYAHRTDANGWFLGEISHFAVFLPPYVPLRKMRLPRDVR